MLVVRFTCSLLCIWLLRPTVARNAVVKAVVFSKSQTGHRNGDGKYSNSCQRILSSSFMVCLGPKVMLDLCRHVIGNADY
jgi:hypothetical protein